MVRRDVVAAILFCGINLLARRMYNVMTAAPIDPASATVHAESAL